MRNTEFAPIARLPLPLLRHLMELKFVPATLSEHNAIYSIVESAFTPYVQKLGRKATAGPYPWLKAMIENGDVYLGFDKAKIVAVAATYRKDTELVIDTIAVKPGRQGEGIGSWMLEQIEHMARSEGVKRMSLQIAEMMSDLLRLYKHFGFRETHKALPEHGDDEHLRVHMEKLL